MATHSSVLAWRVPGTGEPGGLPFMGSHRVGHDCSDLAAASAATLLDVKTALTIESWNLPGSPVAMSVSFYSRGRGFNPWSGN